MKSKDQTEGISFPPTMPLNLKNTINFSTQRTSDAASIEERNKDKDTKFLPFERYSLLCDMVKDNDAKQELRKYIYGKGDGNNPPDDQAEKTNTLILLYERHTGIRKASYDIEVGQEVIFSEELKGDKLSFSHFSLFKNQAINYEYYKFIFQLYENAYPNILILDERIIEFQKTLHENEIKKFLNINLIIPYSLQIDGLKDYFVEGKKIKEGSIKSLITRKRTIGKIKIKFQYLLPQYLVSDEEVHREPNIPMINTVIIHQSILERILKLDHKKDETEAIKKAIQEIKLKIPSLIVTSGRGKTESYSKFAKYLPFSTLKGLIMTKSPDKILLSQVLFKTLK